MVQALARARPYGIKGLLAPRAGLRAEGGVADQAYQSQLQLQRAGEHSGGSGGTAREGKMSPSFHPRFCRQGGEHPNLESSIPPHHLGALKQLSPVSPDDAHPILCSDTWHLLPGTALQPPPRGSLASRSPANQPRQELSPLSSLLSPSRANTPDRLSSA